MQVLLLLVLWRRTKDFTFVARRNKAILMSTASVCYWGSKSFFGWQLLAIGHNGGHSQVCKTAFLRKIRGGGWSGINYLQPNVSAMRIAPIALAMAANRVWLKMASPKGHKRVLQTTTTVLHEMGHTMQFCKFYSLRSPRSKSHQLLQYFGRGICNKSNRVTNPQWLPIIVIFAKSTTTTSSS